MKKLFILTLLVHTLLAAHAQSDSTFFEYKKREHGSYMTVSARETSTFDIDGKQEGLLQPNDDYYAELLNAIYKKCFSNEQLQLLNKRENKMYLSFYFDIEGNILRLDFSMLEKTREIVSDDALKKLYHLLMQSKLDTSRWGRIDTRYLDENLKFDFAMLTTPIRLR
ncbi:hypothetical protein [Carboxylicivirga sp. M1479]|uniref:hypothetical protein n=1 Tax=Carboxylicivirga sp. M1479 TaxID=2594476 RepID=UPI001177614D|nr:hypothetical protein [Carboxylicivirga sp. M1479]TRX72514.1 hypothetical protein FNN09_00825 [Carboxylicivirga sp. M1479]